METTAPGSLPTRKAFPPTSTPQYASLVQLMEESFQKFAARTAYVFMGKEELRRDRFAQPRSPPTCRAWARQGRPRGDHDAQRAAVPGGGGGHPARRLRGGERQPAVHPARAGAPAEGLGRKAIVIIENFANTLQQCIATPVKHVVLATMGDMLGGLKGALVNYVVRKVKKMVPAYNLPCPFKDAIDRGQRGTCCASRRSSPTTSPCCSTPAARRACPRAPCCCTAT